MIPFLEELTRECDADSFFSLVDDTLEGMTLDGDFELDTDDLQLTSSDLPDLCWEDPDIQSALTGLDCFVSGCTEGCAKNHSDRVPNEAENFDSDQFQVIPDCIIKDEPEEKEPEAYTPHWDHCYYLPIGHIKIEPKEVEKEEVEEESPSETEEDSDEDQQDEDDEDADDYFVDVESIPAPKPERRPVGRPRVKREPIDDVRMRSVDQIDRAALKRTLSAPTSPRVAKMSKCSLESSPPSSDSETELAGTSRGKGRGNKGRVPLVESARKHAKKAKQAAAKRVRNAARKASKRTPKRCINGNNLKHNLSEKERRNVQRKFLGELRELLPIDKANPPKVLVLNTAADVVTQLRHVEYEYSKKVDHHKHRNKVLTARLRELKAYFGLQ